MFGDDWFGQFAERLARLFGTPKYIFGQTVVVIFWIVFNAYSILVHFDPYPFILLNLAFSTQAAYAAPLILLAQNRQDDRDRITLEEDRNRSAQTKADTEFLARELAAGECNRANCPVAVHDSAPHVKAKPTIWAVCWREGSSQSGSKLR